MYQTMKTIQKLMIMVLVVSFLGCANSQEAVSAEMTQSTLNPKETEYPDGAVITEDTIPLEPTEQELTETDEEMEKMLPDDAIVAVKDYIPNLSVELKYASDDNFTGNVIYAFQNAYLRYGTVKKLADVQAELEAMGYGLKLWDGFRPVAAQFLLWEICPDSTFVANPNKGFSAHSRGNTVDVTLVDTQGRELEMPSDFDDFSDAANRDYSECSGIAAQNARLLESVMEKYGFSGYFGEWWHFSDTVRYEVDMLFDPSLISTWYAHCNEYISLRNDPDVASAVITKILKNEAVTLLGYCDNFAYVEYDQHRGYVLKDYLVKDVSE